MDKLTRGAVLNLTVVSEKGNGRMVFSSEFMDEDPNAGNVKSVRVWKSINNGFKLQDGEEYSVKVMGFNSPPLKEKQTKDGRRFLYVTVKILRRTEKLISEKFFPDEGVFVKKIQSGKKFFTERIPATLVETRYRLTDKRHIILVKEVKLNDGGQVVLKKMEKILRKDLITAITEQMHGDEESAKELIGELPMMNVDDFIRKVVVKPVEVIEVEISKSAVPAVEASTVPEAAAEAN